MGEGGDIIVVDEACLIKQPVYDKRISRMLGDNASESKLVIIVNPWDKNNFAYDAWQNESYVKIHIPWQQALTEGRTTQDFIDEQKETLTPYSWTVLYESEFADQSVDTLIHEGWIHQATQKTMVLMGVKIYSSYGLDVAEAGANKTILTHIQTDGKRVKTIKQIWIKPQETTPAANDISPRVPKTENINVDAIGVGAGVYSALKEQGHKVTKVIVSEKPDDEEAKKHYTHKKAEYWWHLRSLFEKNLISIPNNPELKRQLSSMSYDVDSGKTRVEKPAGKDSPDYAESLMLACIPAKKKNRPMIGHFPN
jgi:hypothetical protein